MGYDSYKGGASYYHDISDNEKALCALFPISPGGYFGMKGQGRGKTRNIVSENPLETAEEFYDILAYGGIENQLSNGKGLHTQLADGSTVTFRQISSSDGTPVVEIQIHGQSVETAIHTQKIHFIQRRQS